MTPRQNKRKLMDSGKSVVELAAELHQEFPTATEKSLWTMIHNMIYCRAYYPRYAEYLNAKYGFTFKPLEKKIPARQLLRAA